MPAYNEALIGVQFERINERLRAIEAQLEVLSEKAGVDYERPGKEVPELTGADAKEAQKVIAGI